MKAIRTLLACIRQADQKYNLFEKNDKVVVGISGGKDSLALLYCLHIYKKFAHTNFKIQPVLLDLGFPNADFTIVKQYVKNLGYELLIENSKNVYQILTIQKDLQHLKHLPCSICSKMKKAAINKVANRLKYNKVAFAHHLDDAIETLFMNMIYGGKIATFSPKMKLEKANITFIRPFTLAKENDIKRLIKEENIPIGQSFCPADKNTTREEIKNLIFDIYKNFDTAQKNFLNILDNHSNQDIWDIHSDYQINQEGLTIKPIYTKEDYAKEIYIREKVFIEEGKISFNKEFNLKDENHGTSFLILKKQKVIGTFKIIKENKLIWIKRFAILKQYRNKGYGSLILKFLVKKIHHAYSPIVFQAHVQCKYKNLYLKNGFIEIGKPFKEANINHILMKIEL